MSVLSPWLLRGCSRARTQQSGACQKRPVRRRMRGHAPGSAPFRTADAAPDPLDQWSRPSRAPGARPESPMPMPSRSVRPAGNRHSYGGYAGGADAPGTPVACQGCEGRWRGASGRRRPQASPFKAANPLGTSVWNALQGEAQALRREGGSVRRIWRARQAGARAATAGPEPGADGDSGGGYGRARTGAVCARTAYGRAPLASGCRGDAGEERSRAQVPGSGVLLRKAARDGPVIRAAGVSQPRRCRVRRRQERCDRRRSAAAAYAPGRRTTGTGLCVVDRMPARAHARSSRASVLSAGRVTVGHCTPGV